MKDLTEYIEEVEYLLEYSFKNENLLLQAFTRRSYSQENGGENNEVLEFIGDRVLDYCVTKILMDRYGYIEEEEYGQEFHVNLYDDEGSLTEIKKKLVNKKMLAHRIDILGLKDFLYMGKGDIQQHMEDEPSVKEDLFEAILGAIAIDSSWNQEVLENTVYKMLNIVHYLDNGFTDDEDYVALIQQWSQKEQDGIPIYEFEKLSDGTYEARVALFTPRGTITYKSRGCSKTTARMHVAEVAYDDLEAHNELHTIMDELPEDLDLDNAINVLQELAQKGYISMPEYYYDDEPKYDEDGNPEWVCNCEVESEGYYYPGQASSKKMAKKKAAYCAICAICGLYNKYEKY